MTCDECSAEFEQGRGGDNNVCDDCAFTPALCADCGDPFVDGRVPAVGYTSGEAGCSRCHPPVKSRAQVEDDYDGPDGPEAFE